MGTREVHGRKWRPAPLAALALCGLLAGATQPVHADAVTDWNEITVQR